MIALRVTGSCLLTTAMRRRPGFLPVAESGASAPDDTPTVQIVADRRIKWPPTGGERPPTPSRRGWLTVALLVCVTLLTAAGLFYLVWQRTAPPPIVEGQPFHPTASQWVRGGVYRIPSLDIPADVTITAVGDLELIVSGEAHIAGRLAGDCATIRLRGDGDIVVTGSIDNACGSNETNTKDLVLESRNGSVTFGNAEAPARLHTEGVLAITSGVVPEDWYFDVLPHERSRQPLAPVCGIEANSVADVMIPDAPTLGTQTVFAARGVDPDGGAISYRWEFGDGGVSEASNPVHSYRSPGVYEAVLEVADDEGETCRATATVVVENGTDGAAGPGVWAAPSQLVVAAGSDASFRARALTPDGMPVSFHWDFGDGTSAAEAQPIHRYDTPGRYDVTVTASVVGDPALTATGVTSIYVYDPTPAEAVPHPSRTVSENRVEATAAAIRLRYDGDVVFLPGSHWSTLSSRSKAVAFNAAAQSDIALYATGDITLLAASGDAGGSALLASAGLAGADSDGRAGNGADGGAITVVAKGDIVIGSGTVIAAGDGGIGGTPTTASSVVGGAGGRGGDLTLKASGHITVEYGVRLVSGSGGPGGDAVASNDAAGPARAYAGSGGAAGNIYFEGARGLVFGATVAGDADVDPALAEAIVIQFGRGGRGGAANASGAAGTGGCPRGRDGDTAVARGGDGGNGAGGWSLPSQTRCAGDVTLHGGNGGAGGAARAVGGDGGNAGASDAPCTSAATGGDGGAATASGGHGGLSASPNLANCARLVIADAASAFLDGAGGNTTAVGGAGGSAAAVGPACGESAKAVGGPGGAATARGGSGGRGGDAGAYPGQGGNADARGGNCTPLCGRPGGNAWATGGDGGDGSARGGAAADDTLRGTAIVAPEGDQGRGGDARAEGGAGGDCTARECPSGRGGKGGAASVIGGGGGTLLDAFGERRGRDGDAVASGGAGGQGADCCDPPASGGDGGAGGNADANAQPAGTATAHGGAGGGGGNGLTPGRGGASGAPDGATGPDGLVCIVPATHTPTPTATPTVTPSPVPTATPTPTGTPTLLPTPTPTDTPLPSPTVTVPPQPTATDVPASTPTVTRPATEVPTAVPTMPTLVMDDRPTGVFYLAYYAAGRTAVDDPRTRRALTQLIDRAALLQLARASGVRPAEGIIPAGRYPDPTARAARGVLGLPHEPGAAARLVAEVRDTSDEGGWPVEIMLAAPQPERAIAEAIATAWEEAGVRVERLYFELQPGETLDTPRYRDWVRQQRPQAYLRAWRADRQFDVFLIELLEDTPLRWSPEEARVHLQAVEAAGQRSVSQSIADAVFEAEQVLVEQAALYVPLFFYDLQPR